MPALDGKHAVVFGAGLVTPPLFEYLYNRGCTITIATRSPHKIEPVVRDITAKGGPGTLDIVACDVTDDSAETRQVVERLVVAADIVLSLLPWTLHMQLAKLAIEHKTDFATASYVSAEMKALDGAFRDAGIISLNECGVDPGLDHMSAMKVMNDVRKRGGAIKSFVSLCGGLPAPSDNSNPMGYKLSWSPRGVLLATGNNARFLEGGKTVDKKQPVIHPRSPDVIDGVGALEWYENRDSTEYVDIYSIPECETLIRGTYRYPGWAVLMRALVAMEFLSPEEGEDIGGQSFASLVRAHCGLPPAGGGGAQLRRELEAKYPTVEAAAWDAFDWLGLFAGGAGADAQVPPGTRTALDAFCHIFDAKCQYAEGERDMIAMQHKFEAKFPDGSVQRMRSTLIDFGQQQTRGAAASSMARTVCLPLAAGVEAILDGSLALKGVQRPTDPLIYGRILAQMEEEGISFVDEEQDVHIWLRSETKAGERRTPLCPAECAALLKAGFRVTVESSPSRCIPESAYRELGCTIVPEGSWRERAPQTAFVLGLKEIEGSDALRHRHIMFFHCFKQQTGWRDTLLRFANGGGRLYDLEFLKHPDGRRVAAFGVSAGQMGAALGIKAWCHQKLGEAAPAAAPWDDLQHCVGDLRALLARVGGAPPSMLVLGALGRCGRGACEVAQACGVTQLTRWDLEETKRGGPFKELLHHDIIVNGVLLGDGTQPFVTEEMVVAATRDGTRRLTVLADVSCDYTSPNHPFPFYSQGTTHEQPVLRAVEGALPLDVVAIDNLPTLVAKEASAEYSKQLAPQLHNLHRSLCDPVWEGAHATFEHHLAAACGGAVPAHPLRARL